MKTPCGDRRERKDEMTPWKIVFWTAFPVTLLLLSALVATGIAACWLDVWWIVPAAKSLGLALIIPAFASLVSGLNAY